MPVCAGPSEPCYRDPVCSTPHLDDLGGLGCNAGGKGQACRFCGFGPFPACPGPPRAIVVLTTVVAGTVETFDHEAYEAGLRRALPAGAGDVEIILNVTAASVKVEATILVLVSEESTESATLVAETLGAMGPSELSSALGVEVAEVEEVAPPVVITAEKAEVLINDSGLTAVGGDGGAMAAAGCVAAVVTVVLIWYVRRRSCAPTPAEGAAPAGKQRRGGSSGPRVAEAADNFLFPESQLSASSRNGRLDGPQGVSFTPTVEEPCSSREHVDPAGVCATEETSRHTKLRQSFAGRQPRTACMSNSIASQRSQCSQRSQALPDFSRRCEEASVAESSAIRAQRLLRVEKSGPSMAISSRRSHLGDHGVEEESVGLSRRNSKLGWHGANGEASTRSLSSHRWELLEASISARKRRLALGGGGSPSPVDLAGNASLEDSTGLRVESSLRLRSGAGGEAPPTQRRRASMLGDKEAPPTTRLVRRLNPSCLQAAATASASGKAKTTQNSSSSSPPPQGRRPPATHFHAGGSYEGILQPSPLPPPTSAVVTRWQAQQAQAVSTAPSGPPLPLESSSVAVHASSPAKQHQQSAGLLVRLSRFGTSEEHIFDVSPERAFKSSNESEGRPSQTRRASSLSWEPANAPSESSPAVHRLSRVYQSAGGRLSHREPTPQVEAEASSSSSSRRNLSRRSSTESAGNLARDSVRRCSSLRSGLPAAPSESLLVWDVRRGSCGAQDGASPPQPSRRSSVAGGAAAAQRMSVRI
jgi:hypothetical protein